MAPKVSAAVPATSAVPATRALPEAAAGDYAHDGEVPGDTEALRRAVAEWRARALSPDGPNATARKSRFSTWSDLEVPDVLTPAEVSIDYRRDLGMPGEYPYTRGVHPTMYRSKL